MTYPPQSSGILRKPLGGHKPDLHGNGTEVQANRRFFSGRKKVLAPLIGFV
jgi:hypothetical protein